MYTTTMSEQQNALKTKDVARMLNVSIISVQRWARSGELKSFVINSRGNRRYLPSSVKEFLKNRNKK
jgi:predicted site-specific integrase-resolvase